MAKSRYPLFVYSTLRVGGDEYMLMDLNVDDSRTVEATLAGWSLFCDHEMNSFIVHTQAKGNNVQGELLYLKEKDYDEIMEVLDVTFGTTQDDTYHRVLVPVETSEGETVKAYTYIASDSLAANRATNTNWIESGDWDEYMVRLSDIEDDALFLSDYDYRSIEDDLNMSDEEWEAQNEHMGISSYAYSPRGVHASTAGISKRSPYYMERAHKDSIYVWYVAYGSNLNTERFLKYMNISRHQEDKFTEDEIESVSVEVPHGIYFAKSGRWGSGGICFLDVDNKEAQSNVFRAYRMTIEQYWSLLCQENGRRSMYVDWKAVETDRISYPSSMKNYYSRTTSGMYSRIVNLGTINGEIALTMTNSESYVSQLNKLKDGMPWQYAQFGMLNPPSHEYLSVINEGAEQTAQLDRAKIKPFKKKVAPKKSTVKNGTGSKSNPRSSSGTISRSASKTSRVKSKTQDVVFSDQK